MKYIFVIFFIHFSINIAGQVPDAGFTAPPTSCSNEIISIVNNSQNAINYEWDFCVGDYSSVAETNDLIDIVSGISKGIEIIYGNDNKWYGFILVRSKLIRLRFGNSLLNTPIIEDLNDLSGELKNPEAIVIRKNTNNNWIGFIGHLDVNYGITRINFGSQLTNTPTSENIGYLETGRTRGMDLIENSGEFYLIASAYNTHKISILNLGSSLENSIIPSNIYTYGVFSELNLPTGITALKKDGDLLVYVTSQGNGNLTRFNFGNDITSSPVVENNLTLGLQSAKKLRIYRESGSYYGIVGSDSNPINVWDLEDLSSTSGATIITQPNLPVGYAFAIVDTASVKYLFSYSNNKLTRSKFESPCSASISISTIGSPFVFFTESGSFEIELSVYDGLGNSDFYFQSINISSLQSPKIDSKIEGKCLDLPINFTGNEISDSVSSWHWNFGDDIGTSSLQNPSYQYQNPGDYLVSLNVEGKNGCTNSVDKTISIYNPPVTNFSYPSAIICSNNAVEFINETNFVGPDSLLTYQWNINDEALLNATDTSFSFSSGGHKNITLSASIPGCSSDITKTINIIPGPSTSFSFDGICAYDEFLFTNNTTGDDITGYQWDFGDGYFSSILSPDHRFESAGNYIVNLTASNALGCNSTLQHLVPVRYQPVLNFTNDLACSDNSVTLFDQSSVAEANISERYWTITNNEIGFAASKIGHGPSFQLSDHGQYEVTLIGESNYGCLDTLVRNINVYESPLADFRIENTCFGDSSFFQQHAELAPGTNLVSTNWLIDGKLFSQEDVNYRFPNPGDYEVELYVRSSNLCMDNTSKIVTVNPLPEIDFIVDSYCADKLASVNEISNSPNDPITSYSWLVNGKPISNQPEFFYEFKKADDYSIELHVSTDNNCFTALDKTITIHPSPTSKFDVFPPIGASPLKVQFTDRSKGAQDIVYLFSQYNYESSHEENPSYTYHDIGQDLATQIVENEFGCTDTSAQSIAVVIPVYDIAISHTRIESDNPELKLMVGLQNNGSIIINNPVLEVKIEDRVTLSQKIETYLLPGAFMEYEIDYRVVKSPNEMIDYICFSVPDALGNYIDVNPDDNLQCTALDQDFKVLEPYPNPSRDYVQIPIVMSNSADCDIQITSEQGSIVYSKTLRDLKQGLNMIKIDLLPYRNGIYLISVNHSDFETTRKIVVM